MSEPKRVIALVGSYRKGGMVDQAVDAMLDAARESGAVAAKHFLLDKQIEFCTNCRHCTQTPGTEPGVCPTEDDMRPLLDEIAAHDAVILASPMNFGSVTAVTKRFIERLVCYAYWPWGTGAPKVRTKIKNKRAVVVATCAAPAFMARPFNKMVPLMKSALGLLGADKPAVLFIGLASMHERQPLSNRVQRRAQKLGRWLAS